MLWIKVLHIVFTISWFSSLFYLPRIFVNLAQETESMIIVRLLDMAYRLYYFSIKLALFSVAFGVWLLISGNIIDNSGNDWIYAKIALVILVIIYHYVCGKFLQKFSNNKNTHTHLWFRWFNEIPIVLLLGIIILIVFKPF